jgi:hypothetical protein
MPAPVDPADLRRKIAAGIMVAVATIIVLVEWAFSASSSPQVGWDFPVFYIAGRLPPHLLYNPVAFAAFWQQHLAPLGVPHWAPYVRPSVFSLVLRPIAALPYFHAFWLWLGAGLAAYLTSIVLLIWEFRLPWLLLPAFAGFFPAIAGLIGGADVSFMLLALVLALILLERKSDDLAALALTAALCKFNVILLVPVMLLLQRRYRALMSFAIGAALVAAASISLTPLAEYFAAVTDAQRKTAGFVPVGLNGLSVTLGQPWCYPVLSAFVLVLCCWLCRRLPVAEAFCVAITGTLLISPYVAWYDSTLLALPLALVFARSGMPTRVACVALLVAYPLWRYGGGNNGPRAFVDSGVELFMLGYFVLYALRRDRIGQTLQREMKVPASGSFARQNWHMLRSISRFQ